RLSRSGAGHGDVIFNPSHWPQWKDRLHLMLGALEAGAESAEADGLSTLSFCLSLRRQQSASEAGELVDFLLENRSERLVALSIDGNEARGSNTEAFVEAFARAARAGLRRTAHAGESSGPAGVREAVELLGAERIDHGIRCEDDALLVAELADRRIPLGICPSSNVALGVVASLAEHPIDRLRRAGVPVSVNTDDPELYGIELSGEYAACAREFSWGPCELAELARTSIDSSFATEERKQTLTIKLDKYLTSYSQDLVS
ncbi:MAG: adenosine deaminase family protein, partial [Acidimicrobiales bacterium]